MKKFIKNKKIIVLTIVLILALAVAIFAKLIFWKSNYSSPEYKFSTVLFSKIINAQSKGATAELTKDEVNQIIFLYFKEYRKGNLVIKSVEGDIQDDVFLFYMPVSYKGVNLFVWSGGNISFSGGKVKYTPDYFKVGKVSLPKSYVLKKLGEKLKNGTAVEGNSITIDIKELPIGITSVSVKDNKLLITLEKREFNIEDILKGKLSSMKNFIEGSSSANKSDSSVKADGNYTSETDKNSTEESTENNAEKSTGASISTERQSVLNNVVSGLNAASASVSTGAQKAVISQMISVVNNMKDSSYNPYSAEGSVKASYAQLSQAEKAELKAAVFLNVDTSQVSILTDMMEN